MRVCFCSRAGTIAGLAGVFNAMLAACEGPCCSGALIERLCPSKHAELDSSAVDVIHTMRASLQRHVCYWGHAHQSGCTSQKANTKCESNDSLNCIAQATSRTLRCQQRCQWCSVSIAPSCRPRSNPSRHSPRLRCEPLSCPSCVVAPACGLT